MCGKQHSTYDICDTHFIEQQQEKRAGKQQKQRRDAQTKAPHTQTHKRRVPAQGDILWDTRDSIFLIQIICAIARDEGKFFLKLLSIGWKIIPSS